MTRLPVVALVFLFITAVAFPSAVSINALAKEEAEPRGFTDGTVLHAEGFEPLLDGGSLAGWDVQPWHEGHWTVRDARIAYDGKGEHKQSRRNSLWTSDDYGDLELYVEWRLPSTPQLKPHPIVLYNGDFLMTEEEPRKRVTRPRLDSGDSGILLRSTSKCQANIWSQELGSGEVNGYRTDQTMPPEVRRACIPLKKADRAPGQWNAFRITLEGDRMTVVLNGETVIYAARLPALPARGRIGLQHHGDPVEFRNLWVKRLERN